MRNSGIANTFFFDEAGLVTLFEIEAGSVSLLVFLLASNVNNYVAGVGLGTG